MNKVRKRRLATVGLLITGMGLSTYLVMQAFDKNLMYFFAPTQVVAGETAKVEKFRLGGLVKDGSVEHLGKELNVRFTITDGSADIPVFYNGLLPDLFREGQGIIVHGKLDEEGVMQASEVLAKHDENYMPPEVAEALAIVDAEQLTTKPSDANYGD